MKPEQAEYVAAVNQYLSQRTAELNTWMNHSGANWLGIINHDDRRSVDLYFLKRFTVTYSVAVDGHATLDAHPRPTLRFNVPAVGAKQRRYGVRKERDHCLSVPRPSAAAARSSCDVRCRCNY